MALLGGARKIFVPQCQALGSSIWPVAIFVDIAQKKHCYILLFRISQIYRLGYNVSVFFFFFKLSTKTSITAAPVFVGICIQKKTPYIPIHVFFFHLSPYYIYILCSQREIAAAYHSWRLQSILISIVQRRASRKKKSREIEEEKTCES